ncbi:MAG: hypothetical protein A3D28_05080 [Omnitrophica bacterium RIFCSPHIGHO2_02_FULL_63_14]|nr:MAG: hypothetical protein A3D28_05080 [Omnitrophica bacterium RIFCSPHIGHO2_02_FULL_63_14]
MVEEEFVMSSLRGQMGTLQSLVNYLEGRDIVGQDEHSYLQRQLREVIGRLREMERVSKRRSESGASGLTLHAGWLN